MLGGETARSTREQCLSYGRSDMAERYEVIPLLAPAADFFIGRPRSEQASTGLRYLLKSRTEASFCKDAGRTV